MYIEEPIERFNAPMDVLQKWEEPFRELLDEIFYPGYTDYLLNNKPDDYAKEYFYFMALYD